MKKIELWIEGYAATGERADASKLGEYEAENFDEAMKLYMKEHPGRVDIRGDDGRSKYSIWACAIFDNEADARKSFG